MLTELLGAAQSVKTLGELLKAAKELSNYNEIVAAVSEVNAKLMQAQAVGTSSMERQQLQIAHITVLENEIAKLKTWQCDFERHQLHQFTTGAFAHAVKPGHERGEPIHYICTTCANKLQKTILQPVKDGHYLRCNPCATEIKILFFPHSKSETFSWRFSIMNVVTCNSIAQPDSLPASHAPSSQVNLVERDATGIFCS